MTDTKHTSHNVAKDRNFDDLAERFAKKVYGGLKGQIRLAVLKADLEPALTALSQRLGRKLRILDIGAGLAQMSLHFARLGHHTTISDISETMMTHAQHSCEADDTHFVVCPFQELPRHDLPYEQYDVVFCHALLEWLGDKDALMPIIERYLADGGLLSLCFYNPAAPIYRNLIMGNFNHLTNPKPADQGSLTPNHPVAYETVKGWLGNFRVVHESGIRTFYDYTVHKRGGLADAQAVIDMEVLYSTKLPYRLMGRYLHILAQHTPSHNTP